MINKLSDWFIHLFFCPVTTDRMITRPLVDNLIFRDFGFFA
ncbi:hypothetical protein ADIS_3663 [Lunatimonas lonarensis]|uniref:Uncharacterized protein n=1 Tax=Lunatimonas lonarensis TaxID=1232681 RepID=R7ZNW4_9BACT|nr:hypothetical protein ADIS_3663 [Lunatimonas lonarensis]